MNFNADLDNVFFADFGVAVSCGTATTKGILDIATTDGMGHSEAVVAGLTKTLLIKTGSLGNTPNKTVLSISGLGNFKVVDSRIEDDGLLQKLYLADT